MPRDIRVRRNSPWFTLLGLVLLAGCGGDDPMSPAVPNAPPIEIRADAREYGTLDGVLIQSAEVVDQSLQLKVIYSGGCRPTHTFAAAAAPSFAESYPTQLAVFLRHDGDGDRCAAAIFTTLSFDVTPAVRLHDQLYGSPGPFYLRVIAPGGTEQPMVLVR